MPAQSETAAITTTSLPSKPVKLRESCDSCLIAKVKCSKSRPLCGRCLANGAPCQYSPSSRSGKRNRNSGGITKSINTSTGQSSSLCKSLDSPRNPVPPSASYLTQILYPLLDDADRSLLDPKTGPIGGTTSPLLQESTLIPTSMLHNGVHGTNGASENSVYDSSDFLPTPPFHQEDFMDFMQTSGVDPFPDFSTAPPSSGLGTGNYPASPNWANKESPYLRSPSFQSPLDMIPVGRPSSTLITPRPPPAPPSQDQGHKSRNIGNSIENGGICDCFAECLQVLQTLHNQSSILSSTQHGGPPFDIVLSINREAMDRCSTMLNCAACVSKSGRSISTMMLATIFGKVMSLYRAACFLRFGPSTNVQQATAQLAFGAYTITGENRQLLEIEILLLELRKVESILAIYSERFRGAQAEKDDETSVYDALTGYLDKNLHYIVDFLQIRKGGVPNSK